MKKLLLVLALFVLTGHLHAQPPVIRDGKIDCTKICGTKTCCVAETTSFPVCSFSRQGQIGRALQNANSSTIAKIPEMCLAPDTPDRDTKSFVRNNVSVYDLYKLSCNWGCCGSAAISKMLMQSPDLAIKYFEGSAAFNIKDLAKSAQRDSRKQSELNMAVEKAMGVLCIFCCTF